MAGKGYGKNVRSQMDTFKSATPGAEAPDARMAARKSALMGAQDAMAANPSDRIAKRVARISKPGKGPQPPMGTTPPTTTTPPVGGGGAPLPKPGILPGEENKLPKPTPAVGMPSTSAVKKKMRKPTPSPSPYQIQ